MELTNRANHGRELVATSDLDRWRAIVTISGDGLFHEVLNGIFERDDWLKACQLPLGVIPGGTGNGLARTIQFENNESEEDCLVRQATLRAIRCTTTPMDLVCVQLAGGRSVVPSSLADDTQNSTFVNTFSASIHSCLPAGASSQTWILRARSYAGWGTPGFHCGAPMLLPT
jgi:diacylglycerol kinase family enzyme